MHTFSHHTPVTADVLITQLQNPMTTTDIQRFLYSKEGNLEQRQDHRSSCYKFPVQKNAQE